MKLQKLCEGIAILCASTLFIATSQERYEMYSRNQIPYTHLEINKTVGYRCTFDDVYDYDDNLGAFEFAFTNLDAQGQYVNLAAARFVGGQDTGVESTVEWEDIARLEVAGSTPSDRYKVTHNVDLSRYALDFDSIVDIRLFGDVDAELDIVVEGTTWGSCSSLDIEEEE